MGLPPEILKAIAPQEGVVFITGATGSGKSTFVANFVKYYHKLYPKRPIWLFSKDNEDPALDKIGIINRIKLDEELLEDDGMKPDEFLDDGGKRSDGAMMI